MISLTADIILPSVALPGVEDDIAGTGRAAAAAVVVPEAGIEAFRDLRDAQRVQAGQLRARPVWHRRRRELQRDRGLRTAARSLVGPWHQEYVKVSRSGIPGIR